MEKKPFQSVLAFDFGASGGRAVLFKKTGDRLKSAEVHRFSNDPVKVCGTLYWDALRLVHEIKQGLLKANQLGGFDSVGIDTWGVDYGILDKNGNLLKNPVHYRDTRTEGLIEEVDGVIQRKELYAECGLQFMRFNTIYQLYYDFKYHRDLMKLADKILLMPDLLSYILTGNKFAEFTNVSTTGLLDQKTGGWNLSLAKRLGIDPRILPNIILPSNAYGNIKPEICEELQIESVPVIAVASHDTASAVAAVPQQSRNFAFLSCGTWSLFGCESERPVINEQSFHAKFTNERGIGGKITLLKNIMGLWIIQECKRQWEREGQKLSFSEIARQAQEAKQFSCFIDVDDESFELPGDMPQRIARYCEQSGQYIPKTVGEIARCVYESLAMKYRFALLQLGKITGETYETVHIVGGGCNAEILCQYTADATARTVFAGPAEATAMGNALVQLIAGSEIETPSEARALVTKNIEVKRYDPKSAEEWEKEFQNYTKTIGGKKV